MQRRVQSAITRPAEARPITLRFELDEGRVSGSAGCKMLTGEVTRNGSALRFGAMATTRMFCADAMELETRVLAVLEATSRHGVRGNLLDLQEADGRVLARYTGVE